MRSLFAFLLLTTLAAPAPRYRVLFIGNSLTYANDLPQMVTALAPVGSFEARAIALPDFGLEEHWQDGRALRAIRAGGWTHVVLPQGPSSLPESRRIVIDYAQRFAEEIRAVNAQPILYAVWPARNRLRFMDDVTASYAAAARETDSLLAPAGEAWRLAWERDAALALYGRDDFHPSPIGSRLAALVIVHAITGAPSPREKPGVLLDAATHAMSRR